ncbi:unnamed protein product, partial [Amoebophrya sp. A25]
STRNVIQTDHVNQEDQDDDSLPGSRSPDAVSVSTETVESESLEGGSPAESILEDSSEDEEELLNVESE